MSQEQQNSFLKLKKKSRIFKKTSLRNVFVFIFAILSGTAIFNSIISIALLEKPKSTVENNLFYNVPQSSASTSSQLRKSILARNIFNKDTLTPDEDENDDSSINLIKDFDTIPCSPKDSQLPIEIVGIIYTGNPKTNLVTFKDPSVETADVYKEGQHIIDNENYQIYKIPNPQSVEIRHINKKICIYTSPIKKQNPVKPEKNTPSLEETIDLDTDYVLDEIGPGYSKILNTARLIPESINGKTIGFKVYEITPGSLFEKMQLQNGDIITNVNGINLEDPSQGFKIYEVLQDEYEIILQFQRNGVKMTKKVNVR
ncbi:hypothetical protein [Spirobacillus cienkowskii]|jgi:type II secretion system protein C|uniref:PDZ domain-containing protein n=1 Tax=Spirobacillus cienkowskii TaxID=495820 RepID=A0A369KPC8_9BACT|nr:MAG: hypothetical protein DCC88_09005 [Spirobacillus cienkowskii]